MRERTESSMGFFRSAGILRGVLFAGGFVVAEDIAAAAASLQERLAGLLAQFSAETVYVNFDQVGKGIEGFVPDMFGDFGTADYPTGIAAERSEEGLFP